MICTTCVRAVLCVVLYLNPLTDWSLNPLTDLATSMIGSLSANLTTSSPLSVTNQLESDHKAVLACLNLSKPLQNSRLVTRRKLKTINKNKFGSDAAHRLSFIPPSSDPASHYNSALCQLLHGHACTRHHTSPARQSVRTLVHA